MAAGFYFVTYKCVQMMVGSMFVLQFASLTVFVIDGSRSVSWCSTDPCTPLQPPSAPTYHHGEKP